MRRFGLIGLDLKHSFSKKYFDDKFWNESINDCSYELIEVSSIENIRELVTQLKLNGFNVTIPYKERILPLCNVLSPVTELIGAVNCIKIVNQKLIGYNTDYIGFLKGLPNKIKFKGQLAIIFGTGGASKAIQYALKSLQMEIVEISTSKKRNALSYDEVTPKLIEQAKILVNCTPLGTYPNIEDSIEIPYQYIHSEQVCYDLVYNPPLTKFLKLCQKQGAVCINGKIMLEAQAEASWEIWNNVEEK
ncbi:MAG: shikimate dehydrogenase [Bacteroidetes bacterium]|jgi:shikimate dehydrogenase|nr:shikimate dehydrogenase [Bacteroidota bacterium]